MNEMSDSLLAADEPAPVTLHNENGLSPFLIVADHAGNLMRSPASVRCWPTHLCQRIVECELLTGT